MFWLEAIVERNLAYGEPRLKISGVVPTKCSFPECTCNFENNGRHLCPQQEPQK